MIPISYRHEGKRGTMTKNQPKRNARKDRNQLLEEYVISHNVILRSDITKMSFREPSTSLKNYTKKTGQTFIAVDYYTWTKGDMIEPQKTTRLGRPRKQKIDWKEKYFCVECKKNIINRKNYSQNRTGKCFSCTARARANKRYEKIQN
jgi:hypothetical protein